LKNNRGHDLTCFASKKGSKRDLIVGKVKRVDTKIIRKIYKAVKSCKIFAIPFSCLLFEILESEGKKEQYLSIFMGPIYEEMQRQHTYQRTDIGKYSFVNRTITDWNKQTEGAIETSQGKTHIFKTRVRKA
jgi:hypothetical protein